MNKVVINGVEYTVQSGAQVSVINGEVHINENRVCAATSPLKIEVTGTLSTLKVDNGDVNVAGSVGSISCGGDVTCSDVKSNVSAGGDIKCNDVSGNASAGGDISCTKISGRATAGGDITTKG